MDHDEMIKLFTESFKKQESVIKIMVDKALALVIKNVERLESESKAIDNKVSEANDITLRVTNIQVNGLPFIENEDLSAIFKILSSKHGYETTPDVKLRRFNGTDDNKRPIITFPTEFHKSQFLQKFKAKSMPRTTSPQTNTKLLCHFSKRKSCKKWPFTPSTKLWFNLPMMLTR